MRFANRVAVLVGLVLMVASCASGHRPEKAAISTSALSPGSDISDRTLLANAFLTTADEQPTHGYALQLRSLADGHVIRDLVTTPKGTAASASIESNGSLLVATTSGCNSTVSRYEPSTGRHEVLWSVANVVSEPVASPDRTRIAYLTKPKCVAYRCPSTCEGYAEYSPNVLVIRDLASGVEVRTATDNVGYPFGSIAWSPDGQQVAAPYFGDTAKLILFNAAHPDFRRVVGGSIPARHGCSYIDAAWSSKGLYAVESCGGEALLSPDRLVQASVTGHITASWGLPNCIDGITVATEATNGSVLLGANIGYGNDACRSGLDPILNLDAVDGTRLRTITTIHAHDTVSLVT